MTSGPGWGALRRQVHVPGRLRKGEEAAKKAPEGQDVRADEVKTRAFIPTF